MICSSHPAVSGLQSCNREIKLDVTWSHVKRQTVAKMKLLPSVFSSLNSRVKIFVFVANSRRHFSILCDLMKPFVRRKVQKFRSHLCRLPFDLRPRNVKLNLSKVYIITAHSMEYEWCLAMACNPSAFWRASAFWPSERHLGWLGERQKCYLGSLFWRRI